MLRWILYAPQFTFFGVECCQLGTPFENIAFKKIANDIRSYVSDNFFDESSYSFENCIADILR
jgi:hypothetical protein